MQSKIGILVFLFAGFSMSSQELLTLDEAISTTLGKNYDIKIARLDTVVSKNNTSWGNAGLLPNVYVDGAYNYSENNTDIDIAPLEPGGAASNINLDAAETTRENASINLEYTLFDGLGGYHRLELLRSVNEATVLQTRLLVENTVLNTVFLYLNVATQQANLTISEEQLAISAEQLRRAKSQQRFGAANQTQVLQAEVNVKNDSVSLRQNKLRYQIAKTDLNVFMGRDPKLDFTVLETVEFYPMVAKEKLEQKVLENNARIQISLSGLEIAESELSVNKANRYPKLFLNGGYSYFNEENEAGLLQATQLDGWNVGLGLRLNVFDGGRVNRSIQNAKIALEQNQIQTDKIKLEVLRDFENSHTEYLQSLEDLRIEQSNQVTFEQNFERSQIDFDNGQISNTQLRDAQLDLSAAKLRIVTATYKVKQFESQLLQLTGAMLSVN